METAFQDLRLAWRKLLRAPGFALLTICTMALGIGANTAIFSVVNGVLLRPLPYPQPGQLTFITSQFPGLGFDQFWVSAPEFVELRDWNQSFSSVGAYTVGAANLGTERPSRPVTAAVTSELMPTLGVQPYAGRLFTREDTLPGAERVAILSHELWRSSFNADPSTIGRTVLVDGVSTRIVGIMPAGYDVHDQRVQLWRPLTLDPANPGNRGGHYLYLVGRLRPDVTLTQARAELDGLLAGWKERARASHVPDAKNHRLRFDPLRDDIIGNVRTALWVLQGAVVCVLLIACANLANLLLARADSRRREFAIRAALGAGRGRMLRQFMAEGLVIAGVGAVAGVVLARVGLDALLTAFPDSIPRTGEIALDGRVLAFTVALALLTGLIFGCAPLLHLRDRAVGRMLGEGGTRSVAGGGRSRTRRVLVVAEVALAVVLVVGAGLLLRSFWALMRVDAGFDRNRLATFGLVLPNALYEGAQRKVEVFDRLIERIDRIPGVQNAAAMTGLPPSRPVNANDTDFEGVPNTAGGPIHNVDYYNNVTVSYIDTLHVPIVEGRGFEASDATGGPVALVNEALAKKFYPGISPIGRGIRPGGGRDNPLPYARIVGLTKDLKQGGLDEPAGTEVFFLVEQGPRLFDYAPGNMNLVVRSSLPFESLAPQLREAVREIDTGLPIVRMRTMDEVFVQAASRPKLLATLLGVFAGLALLLAAVGTYGILAHTVSERRREIGIRMALGAARGNVIGLVLRQGLGLTAIGLAIGLAASLFATRAMTALLFGISAFDPVTMAVVSVAIGIVTLLACLVPVRSATAVDPIVVLRED